MKEWVQTVLDHSRETLAEREDIEGYLLGRGMSEDLIEGLGLGMWPESFPEELGPAPAVDFRKRHGPLGLGAPKATPLTGRLTIPLYSPRGGLIGFEARGIEEKALTRYLLPEAHWNPVFIGLPFGMERLWAGGTVWIVEGVFDLGALYQVVPETDLVLASLRAKLSDKHVECLRRHCRGSVHMVYDNDETGQRGMHDWYNDHGKLRWGALTRLSKAGVECRAIPYAGGKDPGEIWENTGTEGLSKALRIY
ncbi:toprim domain-containing protein [Deltaproteobacteria bacterium]|nr:toprim domain-containing protein [Deltaproteobacteria bacterium]